ncbi:toxin-antitoxin system, antitoxin component, ribbon-helix-helix domain protein [Leptospira alstonii serovar Pingchang str. 80-412]|uniref:Toxin-antitoxin system, antitoxin component, ribbon-helix-helix domain protein n=2 Tax=Leptospira alstonii TaxID=28452 RepID=M6CMH9_9LEPT|nr:toxin-antitoxin system, antitoxin component, ribbon-helix-helix domain protein [Leptospira alstonii serovar Sichuan str. 79601]EQA78460.1 toxin-antitoxin system, antitoxin component, ribbon-helix-helix domain protein [Leptospira alstonii serovar Pingchang str. 80-412]
MKTTLEIPDILYKKAKVKAAERGISMRALFIEALEHNLKVEEAVKREKAASKLATNSFGWPVLSKKKGVKVTNEIINTIMEEEN